LGPGSRKDNIPVSADTVEPHTDGVDDVVSEDETTGVLVLVENVGGGAVEVVLVAEGVVVVAGQGVNVSSPVNVLLQYAL
jgi:hypothetical protein